MPIELYWDTQDPQILIFKAINPVNWEQYREAVDNIVVVMQLQSHAVYILGLSSADMPRGNGLHHLLRTGNLLQPFNHFQMWVSVVPKRNRVARMFIRAAAQAFPKKASKFHIVETEMAGRLLIRKAQARAANDEG